MSDTLDIVFSKVLERAREPAIEHGSPDAGGINPRDAWTPVSNGEAVLVQD